jgi:2-polyprenyl-6-methoxyphenol hydroxylase-like FAD-dependent oxidoreductase
MKNELTTTCCIVGGGPAGMMLGFLLARAGIEIIVLEKHADFFRDFRGDTIHPSTFNIMHELGLLDDFLKVTHDEEKEIGFSFNGTTYPIADFSHLPVAHKVLGFMPQWDFLNFLLENAKKYPCFRLIVNAEATGVITKDNKIAGVNVKTKNGELTIHASLVAAADGRRSSIRNNAGLIPVELGAPMDVLWFKLSKQDNDPKQPLLHLNSGNIFISISRSGYYQCGYVISKGTLDNLKAEGLISFHNKLSYILPFAKGRMDEIKSWDDISLLSVSVSRLKKWYKDGLLCVGDAAHTMSPIGGVGINLAVQDAVATANILYKPLSDNNLNVGHLKQVQQRRMFPASVIQKIQVIIQNKVIAPAIQAKNKKPSVPVFVKILQYFPILKRIPARLIGMGIRMEHIRTPDIK